MRTPRSCLNVPIGTMNLDQMYELILLSLTIWREARGESTEAKTGMAWVIRNRVMNPGWWGTSWETVITKRWQFTSMTGDSDPNLNKWPSPQDTSWTACLAIADDVYNGRGIDPTAGSSHYFDRSLDLHPPAWATDGSLTHVTDLGAFRFYSRA